ncbi:aldehyde dehydrogenase family protein, partial [Bacillus vallismortis]|nr:aldehyde dehydrogenase family protein [Bacillus vallismortis]
LVYGNTVVFKPATETAVTCAKIIDCFEEAGLPAGVINLITGPGSVVGQGIAENDGVNAVTFTGSNQVGKIIGQAAL